MARPPQYVGEKATVSNSLISEGCHIFGTVINSVLGSDVFVEAGAVVRDSVVMDGVHVCAGATVDYAIVDEKSVICEGAKVGVPKSEGAEIAVIAARSVVGGER